MLLKLFNYSIYLCKTLVTLELHYPPSNCFIAFRLSILSMTKNFYFLETEAQRELVTYKVGSAVYLQRVAFLFISFFHRLKGVEKVQKSIRKVYM